MVQCQDNVTVGYQVMVLTTFDDTTSYAHNKGMELNVMTVTGFIPLSPTQCFNQLSYPPQEKYPLKEKRLLKKMNSVKYLPNKVPNL